ncbi:MAG: VOC family protein [Coriobacteriia bacterium]|nr:VOC family protein [Coriobacteriia bacterium]
MFETIMNKHAINQLGFYVKDLEAAARQHSALFGSGPFFYMDPMTQQMNYRGKMIEHTMATAFGQYGNLQIELIQTFSEPNPYDELGRYGFHHISNWVEDFDGALKLFADAGFSTLFTLEAPGMSVAYIDTLEALGHYIEIHAPIPQMWNIFKQAAENWDGKDPWRKLEFPG